jgi:5'-nucleotidase (lipoprotein e(P4) family)
MLADIRRLECAHREPPLGEVRRISTPAALCHAPPRKLSTGNRYFWQVSVNTPWYRDSAEQKVIYLETYRSAQAAAATLSRGLPPRSWGVILDIDETILDNSDYQKQQALAGLGFVDASWKEWVLAHKATRLPGSKEFIDYVLDILHGQIILVTNRKQPQCAITEENLKLQEIRYDRILCDSTGEGDKNPRFQSVANGGAGRAPVNVLIWIGDNIKDFPSLSQSNVDTSKFGATYFALPNPMYGSWLNNPAR